MASGDLSNLSEVVVLGASRGIGATTVRELAQKGVKKIHLVSRNVEAMTKLCKELSQSASEFVVHGVDLMDLKQSESLFHKFEDTGAFPRHWIFCVGGFPGGTLTKGPFESFTWESVQGLIDLNMALPMRLSLKIVPELLRSHEVSSLIYLSSQAGFHPRPGSLAYASAKWGLTGFAKSLFEELRESLVKVCLVAPSYVDTELIPESPQLDREKMIQAEDVASGISWALSLSKSACPLELHLYTQQRPERS